MVGYQFHWWNQTFMFWEVIGNHHFHPSMLFKLVLWGSQRCFPKNKTLKQARQKKKVNSKTSPKTSRVSPRVVPTSRWLVVGLLVFLSLKKSWANLPVCDLFGMGKTWPSSKMVKRAKGFGDDCRPWLGHHLPGTPSVYFFRQLYP